MLDVYENKELIFTGPLEQLNIPNYDARKDLQFILSAEWRESEYKNYYGEAIYNIDVIYEVPAGFSISAHQTEPGGLVIVTAANVGERDSMTLVCPELEYRADFMQSGANQIALLPVSLDSPSVLNIDIEGDYTDSFSVSVSPGPADSRNVGASDENLAAHLSQNARHERSLKYDEIIGKASSGDKLWEGSFASPSPRAGVLFAYGTNMTVNLGNAFTAQGAYLAVEAGDRVTAANSGRVIFADRVPFDGNLIVIDHGGGLRTWYGRLDTLAVREGDAVEAGQEIAAAGRSGLPTSPALGLYFAASVGDIFINPVNLFDLSADPVSADSGDISDLPDLDPDSALPEPLEE
jgi:murein DD-endopeptidase MepM/ murein hydrolase activator NlpD